jgi:AcrR family transcriptional regulator
MMSLPPGPDGLDSEERSSVERIRNAALKSFATYGTSTTSLRTVAAAAGVSVGLVQHHFANKAVKPSFREPFCDTSTVSLRRTA